MQNIIDRYRLILNRIPSDVTLTVVTKKHLIQNIMPLIDCGHVNFGENYVQEAKEKWAGISGVNLKLIGKLQSNKLRDALMIFDEIHTVDSMYLAEKIYKNITPQTRAKVFYAQINIGNEEQKSGISLEDFWNFLAKSPLEISGIMCIPPENVDPSPYFSQMVDISNKAKELGKNLKISMGMSSDFQIAIKFGTNEVRVGSAILGNR